MRNNLYWAVLVLGLFLCACSAPDEPQLLSGQAMGTRYNLRLGELPQDIGLAELGEAVRQELDAVDAAMSTWRPDSELSRFNAADTTEWLPVSGMLAFVAGRAQAIAELSDGAFDPTAGPLVDAWGFGASDGAVDRPAPDTLEAARARVGYQQLGVRREPPSLRKLRPGIRLDLSAIAKGFAVDRVAALLDARGVRHYLVEVGGELRTRGRRPDGRAWRVGVERPSDDASGVQRVLVMRANGAVATSGDNRNFFMLGDRRYSHIIDPRTGEPTRHGLASVSVIADNCTDADALATALFVLGPDAGYELAAARDLAAMFVTRHEGGFSERITPRFAGWLSQ